MEDLLNQILNFKSNESIVISTIHDNNIFHIFASDIIKYYNSKSSKAYIFSDNINKNSNVQKWRYFVMNKLYDCVYTDSKIIFFINFFRVKHHPGYNSFKFIKYKKDPHLQKIYNKLRSNKMRGKYILLNVRNDERILYENNSGLKLEDYLQKNKNRLTVPFRYCNFSKIKPEEQYEICNNARIFISAHGAGCTNLIFTPFFTPLIEINLRKHWYCDNVCNKHFHGKISMNTKCNGELTYRKYFHKADYHNLCYLLEKKYVEIEAIKYDGCFLSRNPISKKNIYIDGENLIKNINELLKD